ncbi:MULTISPECIES: DUF6318 family protein [Arthrobacter]|uniref:DUF6318 family protein n=3 Tax=Arthrobacter TaxID=1663 RepID=A0ABU9KMD3_9MICC|nr:DUF6318 family protein [Arthrobacter sp. YJM1]
MPAAAKEKTPEGAKAFVGYWVAMLSYAYETKDTKLVKELGTSDCIACQSIPGAIDQKAPTYAWQEGGLVKASAIENYGGLLDNSATVVAQLTQSPYILRSSNGTAVKTINKISTISYAYRLEYRKAGWTIIDLGQPR